ncbi:MAG: hypothetical protein IJS93_00835 [Clostridia bacterium]|nr:hypothetical protein [Clostridia bacterium]
MAKGHEYAVLDIGSHKMRLLVANKCYSTFSVKAEAQVAYDGYANGKWVNEDSVRNAIKEVVAKVKGKDAKIKKLYVGVPAEFCTHKVVSASIQSIKRKKVEQSDVDALFITGNPFGDDKTLLVKAPEYFMVDNSKNRYINALGLPTQSLSGSLCYIATENNFVAFINDVLKRCQINETVFLCSTYSEMLSLFDEKSRQYGVLLVDCGYRSTSVSIMNGDGIIFLCSFSIGQMHLIKWIAQGLQIPYEVAAKLFQKVDLSLNSSSEATYSVEAEGGMMRFSCSKIIEMVSQCISVICNYVNKSLEKFNDYKITRLTINITGDGLRLRGIEACMGSKLGRSVKTVVPMKNSNYNNAEYSRAVGLIEQALDMDSKKTSWIW